jgi:hypothetical protein
VEREGGVRSDSILRKRASWPELTVEGDNGGGGCFHWMGVVVVLAAADSREERCPR